MSDDLTINVDVPSSPSANTADIRANWAVIERRLEALEGGPADVDYLPLTGGELSGPLLVSAGTIGSPGLQFGVGMELEYGDRPATSSPFPCSAPSRWHSRRG